MHKSNHMCLYSNNMCLFEFEKQILFNIAIWDERLPKLGLHRYESSLVECLAFFISNSSFQFNIQTMFKEYQKIITATHMSHIIDVKLIPSMYDEIKLDDIKWILVEQKLLNMIKLVYIE